MEQPTPMHLEVDAFLRYELEKFQHEKGTTSIAEHRIRMQDNRPIKQRYFPKNPKMQADELLAKGCIEPSKSPHSFRAGHIPAGAGPGHRPRDDAPCLRLSGGYHRHRQNEEHMDNQLENQYRQVRILQEGAEVSGSQGHGGWHLYRLRESGRYRRAEAFHKRKGVTLIRSRGFMVPPLRTRFCSDNASSKRTAQKGHEVGVDGGGFETVKAKLTVSPVLACPDFSKPFCLQMDLRNYGLGAILAQASEEGESH
ncbi:hypothetical protein AWZ03_014957 [Drosophila navojoa]|uniref:Reverse transcriptase/retrotransposon-derived protein RNase H-like domain-containing protein n=1 Tax=Drosophila navojoa TaxID=7232 RepID=A0A484ASP3_DRONA|nr:hypothetical protein AWZ03_014957 [Drosophila navojoa]